MKPFFIVQESSCIANKCVVFHRSVTISFQIMCQNYLINSLTELKMLFTTKIAFYFIIPMVFSLVAVYGLKITAISQKYCTTTWQIGFNIFIFVLDSTHSTKPHLFLFCFESKGRIFQINLSTDFLRGIKNVTLDNFRYFFLWKGVSTYYCVIYFIKQLSWISCSQNAVL